MCFALTAYIQFINVNHCPLKWDGLFCLHPAFLHYGICGRRAFLPRFIVHGGINPMKRSKLGDLILEAGLQHCTISAAVCWRWGLWSNWLKIEKISMGYPWDWFKSPFPWVSHGTDLSHHNPWDTHGNVLSHYSWLKLPWNTIPSYFSWDHFKSSDPRVSPCHRTSPEYVPTDYQVAGRQWLKMVPWVIVYHTPFHGTILSQEYAPVISHHQSKSLLITKPLADSDLKWSHE